MLQFWSLVIFGYLCADSDLSLPLFLGHFRLKHDEGHALLCTVAMVPGYLYLRSRPFYGFVHTGVVRVLLT